MIFERVVIIWRRKSLSLSLFLGFLIILYSYQLISSMCLNLINITLVETAANVRIGQNFLPWHLRLLQSEDGDFSYASDSCLQWRQVASAVEHVGGDLGRSEGWLELFGGNKQEAMRIFQDTANSYNDPISTMMVGLWYFDREHEDKAREYFRSADFRMSLSVVLERWYTEMSRVSSEASQECSDTKDIFNIGRSLIDLYMLMPRAKLRQNEPNGYGYAGLALWRFSPRSASDLRYAVEVLEIAHRVEPREANYRMASGYSFYLLADLISAKKSFQEALDIGLPAHHAAEVHYYLGLIAIEQENLHLATKELETAVEFEKNKSYYYKVLGDVYKQLGNSEKADWAYCKNRKLRAP